MPATTNKNLEQPIRGSLVGVWDTPVNDNMGIIDNSFGGTATVALVNTPVTLSPSQYQCAFIRFTGAISAHIAITFPAVGSFYTLINETTNSSAFILTANTTAGGRQVGIPPGAITEIFTDGTNVGYRALPPVGSYWDYGGSSVPLWLSNCSVPPWLNCNGTTFSSATYPALTALLGGTTLPDSQGRYRATLNQGTGRITSGSSTGGVDGNTLSANGGSQTTTLSSLNMPPVPYTDPGHFHGAAGGATFILGGAGTGSIPPGGNITSNSTTATATTGITIGNTTPTNFSNLPPTYMGGLTFIRAG